MNRSFLLSSALLLSLTAAAHAQMFGPNSLVTGDADVLNTGSTVLAYDVSGTAATVNGVSFSSSMTNGTVTLSLSGFPSGDNNGVDGTSLSSNLTSVLINNLYSFGNPATLSLSGLTVGSNYSLQIFAGTTGVGFGTQTVQDGAATGTISYGESSPDSAAYSTTDTFTAGPSGTETVNFSPIGDSFGDSFVIVDAVNLRVAAAVPEPLTCAMLLGGVALLMGAARFRASRA